jgi:hypothetical protein
LLENTEKACINLGDDENLIDLHISAIKNVKVDRLENFHCDNPNMFLPNDISLSVEELVDSTITNYGVHGECDSLHNTVRSNDVESWVEVSHKRNSKGKINLKMAVALICNPGGLNRPDKLSRVYDIIREMCPNIISFSKSEKDFSMIQLKQLDLMKSLSGIGCLLRILLLVF